MPKLFYDDEFDALAQTISNSDKPFKQCAAYLFPHLKPESQYARLKACVNSEKDERLTFGQIIALCKFCERYDALMYFCDETHHGRPIKGGAGNRTGNALPQLQRDRQRTAGAGRSH